MFWPAKDSLVTGSTITSVFPAVVSPMVTAGESSAKSINSRPFTGKLTIWPSVITVLTSVRVVSTRSEATATSTFWATPPGVNVKSNSATCPTCRITFLLCLPNPANSKPDRMGWSIAEPHTAGCHKLRPIIGLAQSQLLESRQHFISKIGKLLNVIDKGDCRADETASADFRKLGSHIIRVADQRV